MVEKSDNPRDEAIGYGRPPKATQFKPGQSGNPRGRPRKETGDQATAARVLGETQRLSGQPKGARVRYTVLELMVMKLKQLTATGHARASALYLKFKQRHTPPEEHGKFTERRVGYLIVPEELTPEEWVAKYSPKDGPPPMDEKWE